MDAGDIWSSVEFTMPASLEKLAVPYRSGGRGVAAVLLAVARFEEGRYRPEPLDYGRPGVTGSGARPAGRRIAGSAG